MGRPVARPSIGLSWTLLGFGRGWGPLRSPWPGVSVSLCVSVLLTLRLSKRPLCVDVCGAATRGGQARAGRWEGARPWFPGFWTQRAFPGVGMVSPAPALVLLEPVAVTASILVMAVWSERTGPHRLYCPGCSLVTHWRLPQPWQSVHWQI